MLNLFSGSGLRNFSIVALGVYPYITASIIMQLLTPVIPALNELSNEGQQGRNKINQYTHILTVPLALLQGYGQALLFSRTSVGGDADPLRFRSLPSRHLPAQRGTAADHDRWHHAARLDG